MFKIVQQFWSVIYGRKQHEPAVPPVVVHDPERATAHDLDDPFFDDGVQNRMGGVIASTGNRKTKNSY